MVEHQLKRRGIYDTRIINAFLEIPRENFIPEMERANAYEDGPVPIGHGQTISQPYIVALMTQLLDPKRTDQVLEIGAGSGYQSAILSRMVKNVTSVEIIASLAKSAQENLDNLGIINVKVIHDDGSALIFKNKKFDKIIVTAAAPEIPAIWIDLLKERGIIVIPEGNSFNQYLNTYQKINGNLKKVGQSVGVRFVLLRGKEGFN